MCLPSSKPLQYQQSSPNLLSLNFLLKNIPWKNISNLIINLTGYVSVNNIVTKILTSYLVQNIFVYLKKVSWKFMVHILFLLSFHLSFPPFPCYSTVICHVVLQILYIFYIYGKLIKYIFLLPFLRFISDKNNSSLIKGRFRN